MLDVRRLHLLRDLAHLGTIAAVAQAHSYTPSAVSQQLAALTREAGVPLLERSGRRVRLTAAGTALAEHAETVLAALELADAELAAARVGLAGELRIGAFPSAVRTLLPAALTALGRDHPALRLMVCELDPADMPDALRHRRLDVALLHDYDIAPATPDRSLDAVPLLEETVFLAAGPGFPATAPGSPATAPGSPVASAADPVRAARNEPWIVGSPGTVCHTVALRACEMAGFVPRIRHHADDFAAMLALVAAGQGVALVPELGAAQIPPAVRMLPVPMRRRTSVACRRGGARHPAVMACSAALRAATSAYLGRPPVS